MMGPLPSPFLMGWLCLAAATTWAEDDQDSAAARQKRALAQMQQIEVRTAGTEPAQRLELTPRPLLTYGDAARQNDHGTLWAWSAGGRPVAFVELYQSPDRPSQFVYAATLTSTVLINAALPDGRRWTPQSPALQLLPLTKVEQPAEKPAGRLSQMKTIAGRLTAHEFWDPKNSRFELRLLVQPVHRYADPNRHVVDGATFVFAHGTNPEILVQLEAIGKSPAEATWQLHAARLGSAELHLLFDDVEVWQQPRTPGVVGKSTDPYWLFFLPTASAPPAS